MNLGRLLIAIASIAALPPLSLAVRAAAACSVSVGGPVVLESDAVDPDVFVWDSRERLVDYAAGHWGSTREIFAHTMLAKPGTRAKVIACYPGVAHPKFSAVAEDAIGVRIVGGPFNHRYGWVLSSDLHPLGAAHP